VKKIVLLALVLLLMVASLLPAAGCVIRGSPTVKTLKPGVDLAAIYNRNTGKVFPDWILGVIYQSAWTKSYGWNSDDYNRVKLWVWLPNGTLILMPISAYQEEDFAKKFETGDVVAFRYIDSYGNYVRVPSAFDLTIKLKFDDVMILEKAAAPQQE
jgi:hypothetical protein